MIHTTSSNGKRAPERMVPTRPDTEDKRLTGHKARARWGKVAKEAWHHVLVWAGQYLEAIPFNEEEYAAEGFAEGFAELQRIKAGHEPVAAAESFDNEESEDWDDSDFFANVPEDLEIEL